MAKNAGLRKQNKRLRFGFFAVLLVLIVGGLWYMGGGSAPALATQPVSPVESLQPSNGGQKSVCSGGFGSSVLTFSSVDKENVGTATGEVHRVWIKNDDGSWANSVTVADAGTLTRGSGKEGRVLFGNNSEIGAGFYPTLQYFKVACETEAQTISGMQKDKNSSVLTITTFDQAGQIMNASQNAQAVEVSGEATIKVQMKGSSRDYFGDEKIALVFDANTNAYDDVEVSGIGGLSANSLSSTPGVHAGLASSKAITWEIAELKGSSLYEYSLTLDAGATEPTTANGNITASMYPQSWFLNAETGEPQKGYNDEQNNFVGTPRAIFTIYVS